MAPTRIGENSGISCLINSIKRDKNNHKVKKVKKVLKSNKEQYYGKRFTRKIRSR